MSVILSTRDIHLPGVTPYLGWFLPSKLELKAMYDELKVYGVGGFLTGETDRYASSSEYDANQAYGISFNDGSDWVYAKNGDLRVRACRMWWTTLSYSLRDIGPEGGLIFAIVDQGGGNYILYEAASEDQSEAQAWSNVISSAIGTTETFFGYGYDNTQDIINQIGHTDSAAKVCDDLNA